MKSRLSLAIATLAAGIGLAIGPVNVALAQNASQLGDLVGARAAGGESDLEARGYTFIQGGDAYGNAKQAYYWNGRNKACVRVETYDGRFRSITNADAAQCNQRSSKGSDDGKAAMAILGLAAIAAAAAHQDNQHSNASNNSAQWDIGYNDGLHGVPYHNVARSGPAGRSPATASSFFATAGSTVYGSHRFFDAHAATRSIGSEAKARTPRRRSPRRTSATSWRS